MTRSTTKKIESGQATAREYHLTRNLDVLALIVTYISPGDLLHLARTCTSIRQPLMDKSSAFIWKACRRQVDGLPDCPVDLSEPEYAHLAFHPCCHRCGEYTETLYWQLRRRYCVRCKVIQLCAPSPFLRNVVGKNCAIGTEEFMNDYGMNYYVDKDQMDAFVLEYMRSSNKKQFVKDKVERQAILSKEVYKYEKWERETQIAFYSRFEREVAQHTSTLILHVIW